MVKAFNTLSAWALQNGPSDASRQVLTESLDFIIYLTVELLFRRHFLQFSQIMTTWDLRWILGFVSHPLMCLTHRCVTQRGCFSPDYIPVLIKTNPCK